MWYELLTALGLMLILEGILPFLIPDRWREIVRKITDYDRGQIRMLGLASMILGVITLYLLG